MLLVHRFKDKFDIQQLVVLDQIEFDELGVTQTEVEARDLFSREYLFNYVVFLSRICPSFANDSEDC